MWTYLYDLVGASPFPLVNIYRPIIFYNDNHVIGELHWPMSPHNENGQFLIGGPLGHWTCLENN